MNSYNEADYNLSFYASEHGFEVYLFLSRNKGQISIKVKSTDRVDEVGARAP